MSIERTEYDMGVIPYKELELFKLTADVEIPCVPPVAYWIPTHGDIRAIGAIARSVGNHPTVLDVGCGNAFISHLLAEEISVIGIDPNKELLERTTYKHSNLQLVVGNVENAVDFLKGESVDVVFNSWMPQREDFTKSIYALNPKAVIFVRDAWGFTGTKEAYQQREGYRQAVQWGGVATSEIAGFFHNVCKLLEPSKSSKYYTVDEAQKHERWENVFRRDVHQAGIGGIAACNIFDVRFRNDIPVPQLPIQVDELLPYPWEGDLQYVLKNTYLRRQKEGIVFSPPIKVKT